MIELIKRIFQQKKSYYSVRLIILANQYILKFTRLTWIQLTDLNLQTKLPYIFESDTLNVQLPLITKNSICICVIIKSRFYTISGSDISEIVINNLFIHYVSLYLGQYMHFVASNTVYGLVRNHQQRIKVILK